MGGQFNLREFPGTQRRAVGIDPEIKRRSLRQRVAGDGNRAVNFSTGAESIAGEVETAIDGVADVDPRHGGRYGRRHKTGDTDAEIVITGGDVKHLINPG